MHAGHLTLPTKALESPAQQFAICLTYSLTDSNRLYAIPRNWIRKWERYASHMTREVPPMINTMSLIGKIPVGRVAYSEVPPLRDYKFIHGQKWLYLVSCYGLVGPTFHQAILEGSHCNIQMTHKDASDNDHDVSLLLNYPHLKFDLDLTHTLSGVSWNLPSAILAPHGILASTLATLVKDSPFPKSSIDVLLGYLCLQSSLKPTCIGFSHLFRMLGDLELNVDRPLNDLKLALDDMPYEAALDGLIDVWDDLDAAWNLDDTIVHLLVAKVRQKPIDEEFVKRVYPPLSEHLFSLFLFISGSNKLKTPPIAVARTWTMAPVEHSSKSALKPQAILKNQADFLFMFDVESDGVRAISDSLVLLLPQWLWIRRMFASGGSSSKSRVIHVPQWMTRKALLAILYSLRSESVDNLAKEDAMVILEHASELSLCSLENEPLEPFTRLLSASHDICFPEETNSISPAEMERSYQLDLQIKSDEILAHITSHLTRQSGIKFSQLSSTLYQVVYAHLQASTAPPDPSR